MFTREITHMTLTNDIANNLFDNITAMPYGADQTFTATLRAVLHKRLPAGESLNLALVPLGSHMITADIITETIRQYDHGHSYTIYITFPRDRNCGRQLLDNVRAYTGEDRGYFATYTAQEDLRVFFIRKLDGLFLVNDHSAIIFIDNLDMRRFHALQMMIPKYLPKLFENNPLSDEETALLKSLDARSSDEYERLIEQFAQRLDMRSEMIRTRLQGFETVYEREQAQKVQRYIDKYRQEYNVLIDKLNTTSKMIMDQQIILTGLQDSINSNDRGESELMEYFLCNKNLSIIKVCGTELEFVAHGYADVFDEDAFDTYARNRNSALYRNLASDATKAGMELLYRAIFETEDYKLRLCAAYRADMRNGLSPVMGYTFPPESRDYLPNPHIQRYGCIGNYAGRFAEYMHRHDYVGAIDQAVMSARNLNFHDSTVMETLANDLSHTAIKCVEDRNGTLMTPRQAIKRMEEDAASCQNQSE